MFWGPQPWRGNRQFALGGLNRQVENLTVNDRLKYWEQMIAISKGQPVPADPKASNQGSNETPGGKEAAPATKTSPVAGG